MKQPIFLFYFFHNNLWIRCSKVEFITAIIIRSSLQTGWLQRNIHVTADNISFTFFMYILSFLLTQRAFYKVKEMLTFRKHLALVFGEVCVLFSFFLCVLVVCVSGFSRPDCRVTRRVSLVEQVLRVCSDDMSSVSVFSGVLVLFSV